MSNISPEPASEELIPFLAKRLVWRVHHGWYRTYPKLRDFSEHELLVMLREINTIGKLDLRIEDGSVISVDRLQPGEWSAVEQLGPHHRMVMEVATGSYAMNHEVEPSGVC